MERFSLKLKQVERKSNYRVEVSNRFTALEGMDAEVGINIKLGVVHWLGHLAGSVDMKNSCDFTANILHELHFSCCF
jgi:hypothetical protein